MRPLLTSAAVLIAGGLIYGACADDARAGPLPSLASVSVASTAVETVGWRRRYWRRYGVWPPVVPPAAGEDVVVEMDDDGDTVIIAPLRPLSCGEYHYWNGVTCVDARYNDPYLGRKE